MANNLVINACAHLTGADFKIHAAWPQAFGKDLTAGRLAQPRFVSDQP